jgi:hypothetical protein
MRLWLMASVPTVRLWYLNLAQRRKRSRKSICDEGFAEINWNRERDSQPEESHPLSRVSFVVDALLCMIHNTCILVQQLFILLPHFDWLKLPSHSYFPPLQNINFSAWTGMQLCSARQQEKGRKWKKLNPIWWNYFIFGKLLFFPPCLSPFYTCNWPLPVVRSFNFEAVCRWLIPR